MTTATTTLISGPDVWMEGDATYQLAAVAGLAGCVRAVGMPDLHPGRGYPIGAAVATREVVHPQLIGGDAGCGARLVVTSVARVTPDQLERRLRAQFEAPVVDAADPAALFAAVWARGARGLAEVEGLPDGLRWLAEREPIDEGAIASGDPGPYALDVARVLGTVGGGNHFAEVARVTTVADAPAAARLGLARDALVVLAHAGSRGLGAALGVRWGTRPLRDAERATYLGELAGACRFARANRLVVTYRLLGALGALRDHTLRGRLDLTHNDVRAEPVDGADAWIHRKGVAPAHADAATIVLGSRGAPSWILRGTGAEAGLRSVAHGAGRKMKRSEALAKLKDRYRRREVVRSSLGGRVICDDPTLLFEEHPDAYKPIEPVIAALEAHGLATRIAALTPLVTVKL
ncbi:MAG: RtcB family protein [Myxococcales bacterium]|nr:RtcB family protein [Myxococcales bacterium]